MEDRPLVVGVDACVLIESVLGDDRPGPHPASVRIHPSDAVLHLAETDEFELLLFDIVVDQARRNLDEVRQARLNQRIELVCPTVFNSPSSDVLAGIYRQVEPKLTSIIRDIHDFEIGACVFLTKPDYFVSSNHADFNQALDTCFGGNVVTPREFLKVWRSRRSG